MDFNDEAPALSMPPPNSFSPRAQETRRYTKAEWETQKSVIVELYRERGMRLKSIVEFLWEKRGFSATERQLKRKISDWQLDKNVKGHEMKSIVRKQARLKLKGKIAEFRVRGQPVPQQKIDRWEKRSGNSQVNLMIQQPASSPCPTTPTLSVVSYNTISERGSMSPYVPSAQLDVIRRHPNPTINENPARSSKGKAVVFHEFEERVEFENSVTSAPSGVLALLDAQSPFRGQSPTHFTAPPSPAPTPRNISIVRREDKRTEDFITSSSSMSLLSPVPRPDATTGSENTVPSSRKRYRQKEENEHRQRLEAFVRQYGTDHPASLDTLFRLGMILYEQGRYGAAEVSLRQVIEGRTKTYGMAHPSTIEAYTGLSRIFRDQGRASAAVKLLREVCAVASSALHPTGHALLDLKIALAGALRVTGELTESGELYQEVLRMGGSMVTPGDISMLNCLCGFATVLDMKSNFEESEKIFRQLALASSLSVGTEHPLYLSERFSLCRVLFMQGKHLESEIVSRQVLATQTKLLGPDHPETLRSQAILANALSMQDRHTEAEENMRDVCEGFAKVFGPGHPFTVQWQVDLRSILSRKNR